MIGGKVMSSISDILKKTIEQMEGTYTGVEIVGNRPHYPVLVTSNVCGQSYFVPIKERIKKLWPQASNYILYTSYETNDSKECVISDVSGEEIWSVEKFREILDVTKRNENIFAEMAIWNTYNIISTKEMKSIEEFKKCYHILDSLQNIVVDKMRSLAIVLLDDSLANREMAMQIRQYLSELHIKENLEFDGVVVISNRGINDATYEFITLYSLVADIIITSNNDAVGEYDDNDFKNIVGHLYGNKVNTIAYAFKERPNTEIALQIYSVLIGELKKRADEVNQEQRFDLQKKMGIYAGKISCINDYLSRQKIDIDLSTLKYLPIKDYTKVKDGIKALTYAEFTNVSWDDALRTYVEENISNNANIEGIVNESIRIFEKQLVDNFTANEMALIKEQEVEDLFGQIGYVTPDPKKLLVEYINELVLHDLQKKVIIPLAKKKIRDYMIKSKGHKKIISRLVEEINPYLPAGGFGSLGNLYKIMTESYIASENGNKHIKAIVAPNATYETIIEELFCMSQGIMDDNKKIFELSFIKEWEKRLNEAEESIYTTLSGIINEQLERKVYLHGNFPVEDSLSVYMFHSHMINGGKREETDLFRYFNKTLADFNGIQYYNTGTDDSLAVLKYIRLNERQLIL